MTAKTRFTPTPAAAAEHLKLLATVARHRASLEFVCKAWPTPSKEQAQLKALVLEAAHAAAARYVAFLPAYYAPALSVIAANEAAAATHATTV